MRINSFLIVWLIWKGKLCYLVQYTSIISYALDLLLDFFPMLNGHYVQNQRYRPTGGLADTLSQVCNVRLETETLSMNEQRKIKFNWPIDCEREIVIG